MNRLRIGLTEFARLTCIVYLCSPIPAGAQLARWTIDAKPSVVLGHADATAANNGNEILAIVTGATKLPNGNILVGDRGDYSMRVFSPNGREVSRYARKGHGPGEVTFSAWMMRCGDFAMVLDLDGSKVQVFSLDGQFVRTFRFSSKAGESEPYRSACNRNAMFVHYGWEKDSDMKAGAYRASVPLWVVPADSTAGRLLARVAGSERWGVRPLPLGKETRVAIGRTRAYVGEAESYDIKVLALDGQPLPNIRKTVKPAAIVPGDIAQERDREVASMGEKYRRSIESDYREITFPKQFPPYRVLLVDVDDNLWVQDYARTGADMVTWTVFSPAGKPLAEVLLPYSFEAYEIGTNYILGRYLDPDESVPEVRMYGLNRAKSAAR